MSPRVEEALYGEPSQLAGRLAMLTPDELHELAHHYNWDDGVEAMWCVVNRADCDHGTAMTVFWLGDPRGVLWSDDVSPLHADVRALLEVLRVRLESGFYSRREISVDPVGLLVANRMQRELLRQRGVPDLFLSPTPGRPFGSKS